MTVAPVLVPLDLLDDAFGPEPGPTEEPQQQAPFPAPPLASENTLGADAPAAAPGAPDPPVDAGDLPADGAPSETPRARKPRSDKGKPRGPRVTASAVEGQASGATPAPEPASAPALRRPTLYDLQADYLAILARLDEISEAADAHQLDILGAEIPALAQRLAAVQDELDGRVEGWVRWLREIESEAEAARHEGERLLRRAGARDNLADRLRRALCDVMVSVERERVHTPFCDVRVQESQPRVGEVDLERTPKYLIRVTESPDRRGILEEFKRTGVAPEYAQIVTGNKHVVIR